MSSVFGKIYNIFWNSSNGMYDKSSSFGISIGWPGVISSRTSPNTVVLWRYQPFLLLANSYTQLKHNTRRFSILVFIGFLSRKSNIKGGNWVITFIWVKSAEQFEHAHFKYPSCIPFFNNVSSLYGFGFFPSRIAFKSCFKAEPTFPVFRMPFQFVIGLYSPVSYTHLTLPTIYSV